MPYASDAQRQHFNANRDVLEAEGVDVDEWNEASEGKDLPAKAKKKKPDQEKAAAAAAGNVAMTAGAAFATRKPLLRSADLFEFLPDDVQSRRLDDAIAAITKASSDLTAQLGQIWGYAHRITRHIGQGGQAREKLAYASIAISPGQTQSAMGPIAPATNSTQFNADAAQLAGFEHHDVPTIAPWMWQGSPQQASEGPGGRAFGYPIDRGKLGNGPGIGGLGGGGGMSVEKVADLHVNAVGEGDYRADLHVNAVGEGDYSKLKEQGSCSHDQDRSWLVDLATRRLPAWKL